MGNLFSMIIVAELSAVDDMMIGASRVAGIWLVELFTYYVIDPKAGIAQPWTRHSWLQFFGFAFVILGQFVYNAEFRLPGLYYPQDDSEEPSDIASPAGRIEEQKETE